MPGLAGMAKCVSDPLSPPNLAVFASSEEHRVVVVVVVCCPYLCAHLVCLESCTPMRRVRTQWRKPSFHFAPRSLLTTYSVGLFKNFSSSFPPFMNHISSKKAPLLKMIYSKVVLAASLALVAVHLSFGLLFDYLCCGMWIG